MDPVALMISILFSLVILNLAWAFKCIYDIQKLYKKINQMEEEKIND